MGWRKRAIFISEPVLAKENQVAPMTKNTFWRRRNQTMRNQNQLQVSLYRFKNSIGWKFQPVQVLQFLVQLCAGPVSELKWFEVHFYNFQPMMWYLKLYSRYCIAYGIVLSEFGLSFVGQWYWCAKLHKQENEIQNDIRFNLEIEIWETILSRRRWKTKTRL